MEVKLKKNPINLPCICTSTSFLPPPAVAIRKLSHIESQPAPLIKSLGRKMPLLERKEGGKIIGEKRGERDDGRRGRRGGAGWGGDEGIKSVFCVVSETHFLVRG